MRDGPFCSICLAEDVPLVASSTGHLECERCRDEHPRQGGYSFEGGRHTPIGAGETFGYRDGGRRTPARHGGPE